MTSFRIHDDVAVVEHDDRTREPREGGHVYPATVYRLTDGGTYVQAKTEHWGLLSFWAESGWHAWDGSFRWRLVPVCNRVECENPILGEPVTDPEDPLGRQFCSGECLDGAAESAHEQHYRTR